VPVGSEGMTTHTIPRPFRRRRGRLGTAALAAVLAVAAAACGDDDDSTEAGGSDSGGSGDMTISVSEPADGAEVGSPFDVAVDTSVDIGEPDTGLHHVHLYYDGDTDEGDYDLVYGPTFTVDRSLDPGEHTIEAVIANADHSLTDARDEVTVTVGDAGAGAGGGTPGQPDDGADDDATTTTAADDPYDY
jgi:hypothetical protein